MCHPVDARWHMIMWHLVTWSLRNSRNGYEKHHQVMFMEISDRMRIHRISSGQLWNNASNRTRVSYISSIKAGDYDRIGSGLSRNEDIPAGGLEYRVLFNRPWNLIYGSAVIILSAIDSKKDLKRKPLAQINEQLH